MTQPRDAANVVTLVARLFVDQDGALKSDVSAWPQGPFTVTVTSEHGKMFEVEFPDYRGELPENDPVLGTCGRRELLANLLSGALRVFLGAR